MKHPVTRIALLLSFALPLQLGCGSKESDKPAGDKPAPAGKPAAPATPASGDQPAASAEALPPECKPFIDALEALTTCDKIPADQRASIKAGYQQMLKAMTDLGDKQAMIDGCVQGMDSLQQARSMAGC